MKLETFGRGTDMEPGGDWNDDRYRRSGRKVSTIVDSLRPVLTSGLGFLVVGLERDMKDSLWKMVLEFEVEIGMAMQVKWQKGRSDLIGHAR